MHPKLASGGDDRFAQQFESAQFFQSHGKINFFAGEEFVIESANAAEVFASSEEKCARTKLRERKIEHRKNLDEHSCPERDRTLRNDPRSAAGVASFERIHRCGHVTGRNRCVRINEEQNFSARYACAGVSNRSDLAMLD